MDATDLYRYIMESVRTNGGFVRGGILNDLIGEDKLEPMKFYQVTPRVGGIEVLISNRESFFRNNPEAARRLTE